MKERRRHTDNTARATYALCTVRDRCELVRVGSLAHEYMLGMGFAELDVTGDCALMKPPKHWTDCTEPRA